MKLITASEDPYLTVNDIVTKLNSKVKSTTVTKYIKLKIIKGEKKFGKWLVKTSDYEAYMNSKDLIPEVRPFNKNAIQKVLSFSLPNRDIYNEVIANFKDK